MAFVKEGETTFNIVDNGTNQDVTIPGTPIEDDIVFFAHGSDQAVTDGTDACLQSAGWTILFADTAELNPGHEIAFKVMGASPDSIVTFNQVSGNEHTAGVMQTWSGGDPVTPEDVAHTEQLNASATVVECPAITPVTDGCLIVRLGAVDDENDASTITAPTDFTNLLAADNSANGDNASSMMASWEQATAALEAADSFDRNSAISEPSVGVTFALRPAAGGDTFNEEITLQYAAGVSVTPGYEINPALTLDFALSLAESETLDFADTVNLAYALQAAISETVDASDTLRLAFAAGIDATGGFSISETVSLVLAMRADASMALGVNPSLLLALGISIAESETLEASQEIALRYGMSLTESETADIAETLALAYAVRVAESEALSTSDSLTLAFASRIGARGGFSISETVGLAYALGLTASEELAVSAVGYTFEVLRRRRR